MLRKNLTYIIGFLILAFFCCWEFGPVVRHLAEESYFCCEELPMTFVLRQPLGHLFWVGRFLMLPFQSQWIGGLYLAILLTLSAKLADSALLCKKEKWQGISFLLPTLLLGWALCRGYNLYMRNEPSVLILLAWLLLLVTSSAALVAHFTCKKDKREEKLSWKNRYGLLVGCAMLILLCVSGYAFRQNLFITCEMQNMMLDEDWEGMMERAEAARRPDRSVAAYHAIAITQMGQTLERAFDLDYDYPKVKFDSIGGMDEGVNYIAECNLHSGLTRPAYHYALEQVVMAGPRLRYFKIMAITAMLNGEKTLCERYLHVIGKMPFQQGFVEQMKTYLYNEEERLANSSIARICAFNVLEDKFEQNFRTPAFLGYNVGVLSGTDETLNISVAAALYSKDMENIILRAQYLQQKRVLPLCVQQALVIASFKRPGLLEKFPGIDQFVQNEVQRFAQQAAPLSKDKSEEGKKKMRDELVKDWRGTYMYYYYCGNLNQTVQHKTETAVN